jgi:hypothetical protein
MREIRPIENEGGRHQLDNARSFVSMREEALLRAGARRKAILTHDLNADNVVHVWVQAHAQSQALIDGSERFMGAFDGEDLIGAVEVGPLSGGDLIPYESPIDRFIMRREAKPEAGALGIFALLAKEGDEQVAIMIDLLRHVSNKYALNTSKLYFGVPAGSPAHLAADEEQFRSQEKYARRIGIEHTLLVRELASRSLDTFVSDDSL